MNFFVKMSIGLTIILMPLVVQANSMKMQALNYYKNRTEDFSPVKAFELFEKLAIAGDNEAKVLAYATFFEFPKSLESKASSAINYLAESARSGNSDAQFNLGLILTKGMFLDQNIPLANQWLEKAADKGDSQAATVLGINLSKDFVSQQESGYTDRKLLKRAIKYLKSGEKVKNPEAMRILGLFHYIDCGDPINAIRYLKLAVDYGDEESKSLLERVYKEISIQKQ